MRQENQVIKNKGGRPKKTIKKDCRVSVRCSLIQRKAIQSKAKSVNYSVSEYLLKMGLTGKIDRRETVLPKKVLQFTGTLNHLAANLNQIAKKRNGIEPLTAFDRADLLVQSRSLKQLTESIKNYLK
ncbi:plasmid mobilization protein [Longitalea arenae]|uniref:plasmid mobilization protein n=1 Tax=Longitalea arenae TaxID=2812558 RepID=UPI001966D324|nr:mobilization protein [Longitalea arenae]